MKNKFKLEYLFYIILFVITVFIALVGVNSSPLFKGIINTDSSVFQIMAKGLLSGKTLYKDLFDHKGPIMYWLNAIAILSNKNIGLFVLEIFMIYVGTIYLFKTAKMILNNVKALLICVIYETLIFIFISGGNYTEEYSLTFSSMALYYIFKIMWNSEFTNKKNWIIIGVTFALNFFIKPTYTAIWGAFGIAILVWFIKEKRYKELISGLIYCLLGIVIISIPIIVYFFITGSLNDFINAYFILNSKYSSSSIKRKIEVAIFLNKKNKYYIFLIIALISNITVVVNKNIKYYVKIFLTTFFILTIALTSYAANIYNHYLIANALAVTIEIMYLVYIIKDTKISNIVIYILIIFILINTSFRVISNENYNKVETAEKKKSLNLIKSEYLNSSKDEVLVLGNDSYIYIYLDKLPNFKYFFQLPIITYDNAIATETEDYIKKEKPKVLINALEPELDFKKIYGNNIEELIINNYEEYDEGMLHYYVLKNYNN